MDFEGTVLWKPTLTTDVRDHSLDQVSTSHRLRYSMAICNFRGISIRIYKCVIIWLISSCCCVQTCFFPDYVQNNVNGTADVRDWRGRIKDQNRKTFLKWVQCWVQILFGLVLEENILLGKKKSAKVCLEIIPLVKVMDVPPVDFRQCKKFTKESRLLLFSSVRFQQHRSF